MTKNCTSMLTCVIRSETHKYVEDWTGYITSYLATTILEPREHNCLTSARKALSMSASAFWPALNTTAIQQTWINANSDICTRKGRAYVIF